ncbi:MAG: GHMP kinase [Rhodocyclaceae bacterium]|nr:GHMP kinase [Rhodocyclaceae bacterium]
MSSNPQVLSRSNPAIASVRPGRGVAVRAPARLHLGFLDLDGGLGRRFGSLGFTLEQPGTSVTASAAADLRVTGVSADRAQRYIVRAAEHLGVAAAGHFHIAETVPAHIGLGSGTQLALALARALCWLAGRDTSDAELARATGRGLRSGIGIAGFGQGGFLVDGGNAGDRVAPVIARLDIPEHWSVLLLYDEIATGLHGDAEIEAFRRLPPFTAARAERLCRATLMQMLPALADADLDGFGAAVNLVQNECGDHFAPAQGGRFASPRISAALAWLEAQGVACRGQSSWGPTGFAVLPDAVSGSAMATALRERFGSLGVRVEITRGRNTGADIAPLPAASAARAASAG